MIDTDQNCLIMSIITQRFYLNPPVECQLFPLMRKTPRVEFEATPLLFEGFFFAVRAA